MARPSQDENGAYGAYGVNGPTGSQGAGAVGAPLEAPNVYHPRAESAPAYEEYADPATAQLDLRSGCTLPKP
jgi:hypothetical protein